MMRCNAKSSLTHQTMPKVNVDTISVIIIGTTCSDLLPPTNGEVSVEGGSFGDTAVYSCNPGFTLEGSATRVCMASGQWSDTPPTCTGIGMARHVRR